MSSATVDPTLQECFDAFREFRATREGWQWTRWPRKARSLVSEQELVVPADRALDELNEVSLPRAGCRAPRLRTQASTGVLVYAGGRGSRRSNDRRARRFRHLLDRNAERREPAEPRRARRC